MSAAISSGALQPQEVGVENSPIPLSYPGSLMANRIVVCSLPSYGVDEASLRERPPDEAALSRLGWPRHDVTADKIGDYLDDLDGTLFAFHAQQFTREDAIWLESLAVTRAGHVVLRSRGVAFDSYDDFSEWCSENRISFVSKELSSSFTVENCLRAATERCLVPRRPTKPQLDGKLAEVIGELVESLEDPTERVTVGVLSRPRSGSKFLADELVLWGAPFARVFHAHDLSDANAERIKTQADSGLEGNSYNLIVADAKMAKLTKARAGIANATKLFLFVAERDPVDRMFSEFAVIHLNEIRDVLTRGADATSLKANLVNEAKAEGEKISSWYSSQFEQFGVDISEPMPATGLAVYRGPSTIVVTIRTEQMREHLRSVGLLSPLASANSAHDRGYEQLYARFKAEFQIDPISEIAIRSASAHRTVVTA